MSRTAHLRGASGREYIYYLLTEGQNAPPVAGNYVFAIEVPNDWKLLYVGETENLRDRLVPSHEKIEEIGRRDNFSILFHQNASGEKARRDEERDLIRGLNPPYNDR